MTHGVSDHDRDGSSAQKTVAPRAGQHALAAAQAWLAEDPDEETSGQLIAYLDEANPVLDELFDGGRVGFGTAGLRAPLGPGPNRMNRLVVRQTTAGLMAWLPDEPTIVIGYDARHGSRDFADDAARVVAALGGHAELLPRPLPTPVLAHAVLARTADAGVMITASHNPPADNGYKLYLADGIQLVGPADAEIAALIVAAASRPVRVAALADPAIVTLGEEIVDAHLEAACSACVLPSTPAGRDVRLVYTALHGVGAEHLARAVARAGFPPLMSVGEQHHPDPDFPTVAFPNPEEPGALDLALALAEESGGTEAVDGVIANDPDADRLALAVGDRQGESFVTLTGDQLGVLLADHLLRFTDGDDRLVACSLVSSRLLSEMASAAGIEHTTTLTGFKWVARPIVDRPDRRYLFGYEEALGYCIGSAVRDKDGISAALVAAEMMAGLKAAGQTVWDRLDMLAARHGAYLTGPVSVRFEGPGGVEKRTSLMRGLIDDPPSTVAGSPLIDMEDLSEGRHFAPATGAVMQFADRTRVIVRPSGTEPKLKTYVEVVEPVAEAGIEAAWRNADDRLVRIQQFFLRRFSGD